MSHDRTTPKLFFVVLLVAVWLAAPQLTAAQEPITSVSMKASTQRLLFGQRVRLSGRISPPSADQPVQVIDAEANVVAEATTDADGRYGVRIQLRRSETLHAQWLGAMSDPIEIGVKPLLKARLSGVRLFAHASVKGNVRPAIRGGRARLVIYRSGRWVASKQVRLNKGRWISGRLRVKRPGKHRVRIVVEHPDFLPASARTRALTPDLPGLGVGSSGGYVKLLEKRLRSLGFYLQAINQTFDYRTADAVVAFNKVRGRARVGSVDSATWNALAKPRRPQARSESPRYHIEVDQTRQILFTVRKGKVTNTIHISTGAGGATHDGTYRVYRKLEGHSPGRLYYPSYFDGLRAIHGWTEVPTYAASHGCVRVPYWTAKWIHRLAAIGTEVQIYH